MSNKASKIKKIESLLSQKIKNVYQERLDHRLDNISYKLSNRTLIVTLEGSITFPEKLLQENDRLYLAKQVRKAIDRILHPQIRNIIEEELDVKIVDFLSDSTVENNLTAAIAIFDFKPTDI